jgi:hypothetical protein
MRHNMHASTVTPKEYQRRYKPAPRLPSNVIFGAGDGILGKYARDNAIRRQKGRLEKDAVACRKKKKELTKMVGEYKYLKVDMSKENFKWTITKLNIAIKCKTRLDDIPRPKGKEALLEQWDKIKRRPTPQPSPEGSNNKDASDDNDGTGLWR